MKKTTFTDFKQNRTLKTKRWLGWLMFCMMLLYGQIGVAQIAYSQGWEEGELNSWVNSGDASFSASATSPCEGTSGVRVNLYVGYYDLYDNNTFTSPNVGISDGTEVSMNFSYKVTDYSFAAPSSAANADSFQILVQWANSATGPWTTAYTINENNHTPSLACQIVNLSFTPGSGNLYVRFNSTLLDDYEDIHVYIDEVQVVQGDEPCFPPSDLGATNITVNSADLGWNSTATSFDIKWGIQGFNVDSAGTLLPNFVNGATLSNLSPNTSYSYYVRANCGNDNLSTWAGPFSFNTLCAPQTAPIVPENFTNYGTDAPTPLCWSEAKGAVTTNSELTGSTSKWSGGNFANTGTNKGARVNLYGSQTGDWLISPQIDLGTTSGVYRVKYDMAVTDYYGTTLQSTLGTHIVRLIISTDGGETWSVDNSLTTYTGAGNYSNTGQTEVINLTDYSGIVKFAFVATTSSTSPDVYFFIDNFVIDEIPTCFPPSNIEVDNITTDSAVVTWEAPNEGNLVSDGYVIEIRTSGQPGDLEGFVSTIEATNLTAPLADLSPGTAYTAYIKTLCTEDTDESVWESVSFVTACELPDAPATISFTDITAAATKVNFVAPATAPSGYVIFRSTSDVPPVLVDGTTYSTSQTTAIASLTDGDNTYFCVYNGANLEGNATSLTSNTEYYYYVFSRSAENDCFGAPWYSELSLTDSEITAPATPTTAVVSAHTDTSATISWTASNVGGEVGAITYTLEVYTDSEYENPITGSPFEMGTDVSQDLTGLTASTQYFFRIKANNTYHDSGYLAGNFTTTQVPATLDYEQYFEGTHGWALVNGTQTNQWAVGSATGNTGSSLYISNDDGITNTYTNNSTTRVQAYRDIAVPAGTSDATISFDWKGEGESNATGTIQYDFFRVWLVPASYIPTAGTQISVSNSGGGVQVGGNFNDENDWTPYVNTNVDLSSFAGGTVRLVFEWSNDFSGGTGAAAIDNIKVTLPACPKPFELTATNITDESADLGWTSVGTTFDIKYGVPGFDVEDTAEGTLVPDFDNGETLSGLTENTTYEFYVRRDCDTDGESAWAGPFSFTTVCSPFDAPFLEEFSAGSMIDCWTNTSSNTSQATGLWKFSGTVDYATGNTRPNGTFAWVDGSDPSNINDVTLMTPMIDVSSLTTPLVAFDYFSNNTGSYPNNIFTVEVYDGTSWTQIYTDNTSSSSWRTIEIPLETFTGTVLQIRFIVDKTAAPSGNAFYNDILLDNVAVKEAPTCYPPLNIEVGSITKNSAEVTWEVPEFGNTPEDGYVIEIRTEGVPGEATGLVDTVDAAGLSATLANLEPSTSYTIYIKSLCAEDTDESYWSEGVTFTTLCDYPDFELTTDEDDLILCGPGEATLEIDSDGIINWYDAADATEPIFTGTTFERDELTETTSFWVESVGVAEGSLQVGEGTSTSDSFGSPFYHNWGGHKYQYIFTAEELNDAGMYAGPISALAFDVTQTAAVNFNDFTIAIGETEQSVTTSTHISGLTQVYSNTSLSTPVGIHYYEFDDVFEWDGESNIVVQINWSNNNSGSISSVNYARVRTHTTSSSQTTYTYADNRTAAQILVTMTGSVDNGSGSTSGGTSTTTRRPNTYFIGTSACISPREEVVVTVEPVVPVTAVEVVDITGPTATLEIESAGTLFDIEYGISGFEQGTGTVVTEVTSPYIIEGLTEDAVYDVYVRTSTYCGEWFGPTTFTATAPSEPQIITAEDVTKVYGDAPFTHGSSDSGLALTYVIADQTVATFVGGQLVIQGAGETEVTAKQAGNSEFLPAEDVTFTLTVTKADLTVTAEDQTKVYDGELFEDWTVTYEGFVYEEQASDLSGELVYEGDAATAINAGTYTIEVSGLLSDNYTITYEEGSLTITKATLEGITFEDQTVTYDGEEKSIFITGDLPAGVTVTYTGNEQTEIGDYEVTAHIDGGTNYEDMELEAVMSIRGVLTNIVFEDAEFTYDGTAKSIFITGELPEGVTVTYTSNAQTESGEYEVVANIEGGEFYSDLELTATLTINKATISGILFTDAEFVYNCTAHSMAITGELPEGVTVSYVNNGNVEIGTYTVTANINGGENYEDLTLTAVMTIEELLPTIADQFSCGALLVADVEANLPAGWETKWYAGATSTDAIETILTSGVYYVSSSYNDCESSRIEVQVTIEDVSIPTGNAQQQFCISGQVSDLVVEHTTGTTLQVYETPTGGVALNANYSLYNGTFYVSEKIGDCESARLAIQVTITPSVPALSPAEFVICGHQLLSTIELDNLPNAELVWYANATTPQAMSASVQITSGTFYVSQKIGVCESLRVPIVFEVQQVLPQPTATSIQQFCISAIVSELVATGAPNAVFKWYASATSATPLESTATLQNGTYYVSQELNGCESARRAVSVIITNLTAPQATSFEFCGSATVADFSMPVISGVTYNWYLPNQSTPLPSTHVLTNGNYLVKKAQNGCESNSAIVQVTIKPIPNSPTGQLEQEFIDSAMISDLEMDQPGVVWYITYEDALNGNNPLQANMPLQDGNVYYGVLIGANGCPSLPVAVTVTITLGVKDLDLASLKYYPNPVETELTVSYKAPINSLEVYDLTGKLIKTQAFDSNDVRLDVSSLSSGTYMIKVHTSVGSQFIKIVKK